MAERTQTYNTVVGYFSSNEQAERALQALIDAGFNRSQMGIAGRSWDETTKGSAAPETHLSFWQKVKAFFEGEDWNEERQRTQDTTGESVYDYESGDFQQSLGGYSIPEERSRYFNDRFNRDPNGVLLSVEAGNRTAEAEEIIEKNGGDVGRNSGTWSYESSRNAAGSEQTRRMQLYGEALRVHRERTQRGEARLRKQTVTENQTVNVPVTREELVVERTPVSGEKAAPGARLGENAEVRVPLSEERVKVEKEPVVREEVRVGKKGVTNVESHDEKLRHEELNVEDETKRRAG
ncbi:MAG TPA: YsnF/AvaK domain-containing protein [Acidobacteriaceae bacterium]|nr:YsnF/AvaK domain-containing protein [Acidobacteriaceae bacterium]